MIELHITMTGKGYHPRETYRIFAEDTKRFNGMAEAKDWLKAQYGTCKRAPMYIHKLDGSTACIGYIYGFRSGDCSHYPVEKWLQQDWVEFRECNPMHLSA